MSFQFFFLFLYVSSLDSIVRQGYCHYCKIKQSVSFSLNSLCAFLYQSLLDHLSCCGSLIKGTGIRFSRGTGSSGSVQLVSLPVLISVIGSWTMRCWTRGAEEPGSSREGRERRWRGGWPVCVWNLFVWLQSVQEHCGQSMISNIAKGTMDPRIEFISQVPTQILIKFQFQTLD